MSTVDGLATGRSQVTRRQLLRAAAAGGAVAAVAEVATRHGAEAAAGVAAVSEPGVLDLHVNEGYVPMVDDSLVYMRGFGDRATTLDDPDPSLTVSPMLFTAAGDLVPSRAFPPGAALPPAGRCEPAGPDPDFPGYYLIRRGHWASYFPRRTILAETGARIRLRLHNGLAQTHGLAIRQTVDSHSVAAQDIVSTGPVQPGASATLEFDAPAAGTYLYEDPTRGDVERVLGLHGVLVVVPRGEHWRVAPGGTEFERQWLWITHDVDPEWARRAAAGQTIDPVATPVCPRYFLLNDRSGFRALGVTDDDALNLAAAQESLVSGAPRRTDVRDFSADGGEDTVRTGQLIRIVNAGVSLRQMHFHGNHVWTLGAGQTDFDRSIAHSTEHGHTEIQCWQDTVELHPMTSKVVVLPLKRPPDVLDPVWETRTTDWPYPVHCHTELSQTAAGGLYPGGVVADWVLTMPGSAPSEHSHFATQVAMSDGMPRESNPATEHRQRPDREFELDFFNRRLRFPDGAEHDMWCFESATSGRSFPGPLVRVAEGEVVHATLRSSKRTHTIHWHGIEPDPRNDGVGHTSFEVSSRYTYQWQPQRGVPGDPNSGGAGTFFYHCHVNTVLHVQLGMFGPLIVDPVVHPDYPVSPGGRRTFVDGPEYDIATETLLITYCIDPAWHDKGHQAGQSGEDAGLNVFEPRHFYVLGGNLSRPPRRDAVLGLDQVVANVVGRALPTLLRVNNGNYLMTRVRFTDLAGVPVAMAEPIADDGRPYRDTSRATGPSLPPRDLGNGIRTDVVAFGAAERYDLLLHPPHPGEFRIHVDWFDWITEERIATRSVPLLAR